ncbi:DCC1-like thiol-disulfide oxidoreductase family protein [Flavobacterium sp. SORGH_AS_0622]|jgi:predicted DCC family thiol-disulfide oxidoreductase YuxK|uniref:DCC1-like thiol-disulfide oxidoreductase family protein n=1 Tax=Flavobacterium sp. SORGH_AS_0622 TaxID=3041772 RepID=UPI00278B7F57|nr:DCC1-like thiol-disulfide oxidoreductase family protein [Flavobacterium sp. SORGH_AS_0622]MDQ1164411.1 putative DCC family thiol-disulfide oxidoreductase YuxK [Flavobacterium sp. SORGH_AS_0622]
MKLIIFYDNWCPHCSKFANIIKKVDWLKLIDFRELRNESHINQFNEINVNLAKQQMASYTKGWNYGYISLFLIFVRIPLLWFFLPFFWGLKISGLGQYLYTELALKRMIIPLHCDSESCEI